MALLPELGQGRNLTASRAKHGLRRLLRLLAEIAGRKEARRQGHVRGLRLLLGFLLCHLKFAHSHLRVHLFVLLCHAAEKITGRTEAAHIFG